MRGGTHEQELFQATRSRRKKYRDCRKSVGCQDGVHSQGMYEAVKRWIFGGLHQKERVRRRSREGTPRKNKRLVDADEWQGDEAEFYHAARLPE